jgi:hypothetical protein
LVLSGAGERDRLRALNVLGIFASVRFGRPRPILPQLKAKERS